MTRRRKQGASHQVEQLVAYALWGLVAFAVGMLSLWVTYGIFRLPYSLSVAVSVATNLITHYTTSRLFVFTRSGRTYEEGFAIFALIGVLEIIGITALAIALVEYGSVDEYVARILSGILASIIGFWANGHFTFRAL